MARKILVVEDESITRASIADVLHNQGYEVDEARDGIQALDLLGQRRFDLIVTDLVMPGMDGFKLIAGVRSISPETPIVLITAYLSEASGKAILAESAELILKPIEPDDLVSAVKRVLGHASSRE